MCRSFLFLPLCPLLPCFFLGGVEKLLLPQTLQNNSEGLPDGMGKWEVTKESLKA